MGDLNIAPREDDVWSHKQLLKVVSHTPEEVAHLGNAMEAGGWHDVTRADIPEGQLYSWWSYRARDWDAADKGRRLDHVWASRDIAAAAHGSRILRAARGWEKPSTTRRCSRRSICERVPAQGRHRRAGRMSDADTAFARAQEEIDRARREGAARLIFNSEEFRALDRLPEEIGACDALRTLHLRAAQPFSESKGDSQTVLDVIQNPYW